MQISLVTCAALQSFEIVDVEYSATGFISTPNRTPLEDELLSERPFAQLALTIMHCIEAETALSQGLARSADSETESTQAALRVLHRILRPLDTVEGHTIVAGLVDDGFTVSGEDSVILTCTLQTKEDLFAVTAVDEWTSSMAALFVKRAPESVLERCNLIETGSSRQPLTQQLRDEIDKTILSYGSQGLRTLALAYVNDVDLDDVDLDDDHNHTDSSPKCIAFEQEMTFAASSACSTQKLIDNANVAWEYRKVLLRRLFFTGEHPLFDGPIPLPPRPASSQSDAVQSDSATEPQSSLTKAASSRSPLLPTTGVGSFIPNRPASRPSDDEDADQGECGVAHLPPSGAAIGSFAAFGMGRVLR
ncbi:Ca2+-transporting ATPase [Rhodotorula toruloides]|uniref:Ca2+-transporting ATPase n=1 Tax=Rhodotorula toruloides TaxID=5286 RepID=A0A511KGH6_RHOTO|nr:Ca2+-transporting ATPase [Rhodotorula toruloides]